MHRYICEGTCGGSVSAEEFSSGKNVCATAGCTHEGHPLVADPATKKRMCFSCVASAAFLLVGSAHLMRAVLGWGLVINGVAIPIFVSFGTGILLVGMAVWGWQDHRRQTNR